MAKLLKDLRKGLRPGASLPLPPLRGPSPRHAPAGIVVFFMEKHYIMRKAIAAE
jgi:hypothetical protein